MKLNKIFAAVAVIGVAAFGTAAHALPTIKNLDGLQTPFGGFDWTAGSAAWTTGFTAVDNSTFSLDYASTAAAVTKTDGSAFAGGFIDGIADGLKSSVLGTFLATGAAYEYTVFAHLTEKVVSCAAVSSCTFMVTGGTFDIYYNEFAGGAPSGPNFAKESNGTGYQNGVKIISGTINGGPTTLFDTVTGGQASLSGSVISTNLAYVNPALVGTQLTSTLQLGSAVTNFTIPTGYDYNNDGVTAGSELFTAGQLIFQADANQTFSVPEPGALLLAGFALAACGLVSRRKSA